jgi:hypothetical protein
MREGGYGRNGNAGVMRDGSLIRLASSIGQNRSVGQTSERPFA